VYARLFKRSLDALLSGLALAVLAPVLGVIAAAILLEDGRPVIFRQVRAGRDGGTFFLRKFRSMPVDTPNVPSSASKGLAVTRVGGVLRRTNLDELPQLINILRGDMSLVGPRPALPSQKRLLLLRAADGSTSLRPGLTGWAQVNSYEGMPEEEKAELDAEYARQVSLLKDLGIVLRTLPYLAKRPPVY